MRIRELKNFEQTLADLIFLSATKKSRWIPNKFKNWIAESLTARKTYFRSRRSACNGLRYRWKYDFPFVRGIINVSTRVANNETTYFLRSDCYSLQNIHHFTLQNACNNIMKWSEGTGLQFIFRARNRYIWKIGPRRWHFASKKGFQRNR